MDIEIHKKHSASAEIANAKAEASFSGFKEILITPDRYSGALEITPTNERQTVPTSGYYMASDIIVNPIPQNYGLIGWDGFKLTVT